MGFSELSYHVFKDLEIPFDEKGKTPTIRIPMGDASFKIITVANL